MCGEDLALGDAQSHNHIEWMVHACTPERAQGAGCTHIGYGVPVYSMYITLYGICISVSLMLMRMQSVCVYSRWIVLHSARESAYSIL